MTSQSGAAAAGETEAEKKDALRRLGAFALAVGRERWKICGLIMLAATMNYVDRQLIAILKPELARVQHWSDVDYANIVTTFQVAYAIGLVSMGWLLDRVGTKAGFAIAASIWGVAAMCHSFARSALGFAAARFALGIGEGGVFPAGVKVVAQWFPKRERALAVGLFNSGVGVGAILTPLAAPFLVATFGLYSAFLVTGLMDLLWIALWLAKYRPLDKDPTVSAREMEWIKSDPVPNYPKIRWLRLLPFKQTWVFAAGKFLTDPVWWLYLFWVPSFLHSKHGLSLSKMGPPLVVLYLMANAGGIFGGWLSSAFIRAGRSVNASRKIAMMLCAALVVPIVFAASAESPWTAVVLIGLAATGQQGFASNLFTLNSDLFPEQVVGSVVGFGGMFGAIGGILMAQTAGRVLQATGSYAALFVAAPVAYVVAIGLIHILSPRLEPMSVAELSR